MYSILQLYNLIFKVCSEQKTGAFLTSVQNYKATYELWLVTTTY